GVRLPSCRPWPCNSGTGSTVLPVSRVSADPLPSRSPIADCGFRIADSKTSCSPNTLSDNPKSANQNPQSRPVVNLRQALELLALDVGQERPAAGGNVGHLVGITELLDGFGRLAPAHYRDRRAGCHRLRDGLRSLAERRLLEPAHRTVPD